MKKERKRPSTPKKKNSCANTLKAVIALPVYLLSILMSLLLLIAAYACYFSPLDAPLLALFGLAFPLFAVASFLLLATLLVLHPRYAIVALVALLLSLPALWHYCPINTGNNSLDTNRDSFSVLTYNTFYFNPNSESDDEKTNFNHTLQYIFNYDADVVLMQEVSIPIKENSHKKFTAEQIEHLEKTYPYRPNLQHNKVFSKYPITVLKDTFLSPTTALSVLQTRINDKPVTLFDFHLESIGLSNTDKEVYLELTSQPDSIKSNIGNIKRLTRKFLNAFEARAKQVAIIDSMAREIGGNIILCGDINDTPNSYAYRRLKKNRNDAFMQLGSGPGYTYLADRIWVRIDYVLYDGDFDARYMQVGDKSYSDHYPLYVEFEWK